jgi:MFS family permease
MTAGAMLSAISALLLAWASSSGEILLFGGLMSVGSAAFAGGSWALLADLVPRDEPARYLGLANFSTAGAAAAAGLFGPVIDWVEGISPGMGFIVLFILASIAFLISALPLRGSLSKEDTGIHEDKTKVRSNAAGLAILPVPADPALLEKDNQDPQGGSPRL